MYADNSLEFGKACEDHSWNHCTSTPHRSGTNGIAERAVRRAKEGTSAVLLQSGLDEKLVGRWTDHSIWFIGWVSPYFCEGSVKNPSIWKESFTWIVPRMRFVRGGTWMGDVLVADLEELETEKTQCKRGDISQRERKFYLSSRRWTNQTSWRRSGTENIHLDTGTSNSRRRSRRFSWRIRRVSSTTSWLISGCRWSDKRFLVHVRKLHIPPSRWTKSQTLLAERRIIPCSTSIHWRLQNYPYKLGCYARTPHRWLLEYRWVKRFVWFLDRFHSVSSIRKISRWIFVVRGETDKKAADIQARSFMAITLDEIGKKCPADMKNQNSIMPDNNEEFVSLTLRTRNSKKPSRMLARNWSRHWLPLCFARQARTVSMGWPVVNPMRSNQNLRVFWKPVNPQDCVRETLYRIIMKTILQEEERIHYNITIWHTNF